MENNNQKKEDINKYLQKMHPEQGYFFIRKLQLDKFDKEEEKRELTVGEKAIRDRIKADLFSHVVKYGRSLAASQLRNYAKSNDYLSDVVQTMAFKFFLHLPDYDPRRTTPTTFFKPYFLEAITEYKLNFSQNLKQNDSNNIGKVRAAIRKHEMNDEYFDVQILSADTGLSIKVVKNTLDLMNKTLRVNIDDVSQDLKSNSLTPEEEFLEEEFKFELYSAVSSTLEKLEDNFRSNNPNVSFDFSFSDFLFAKVNLKNDKELNHAEMAKLFGIPSHIEKNIWNTITMGLANNEVIHRIKYHDNDVVPSLNVHSTASDVMEADILNSIETN